MILLQSSDKAAIQQLLSKHGQVLVTITDEFEYAGIKEKRVILYPADDTGGVDVKSIGDAVYLLFTSSQPEGQ